MLGLSVSGRMGHWDEIGQEAYYMQIYYFSRTGRSKKIAEELEKQFGIKIDKRHIQVSSPIRSTGLIDVPVKIYQDVTGVINIRVNEG